jgi:hypothetical protein
LGEGLALGAICFFGVPFETAALGASPSSIAETTCSGRYCDEASSDVGADAR